MTVITSMQNSRVKNAVKLRSARHRAQQQKTLLEGYRVILAAVENGYPIDAIFFCPALFLGENEHALIQRAAAAGAHAVEVAEPPFRKMAYRERPEGLLAVAPIVRTALRDHAFKPAGFYIIVESIQRPGNLGSILRSADAAGVHGVIMCEAYTDLFNPDAIRASVGALFTVPTLEASTQEALAWRRKHRISTLAATPHTDRLYTDVDMTQPLALVVGAEQYGLSDTWMAQADLQVKIPMFGKVDSLNVATAATLLLYEVVRQRRGNASS
jgi:TrmH family RNA methyltransferase